MTLAFVKLAKALGAEITGIDLSQPLAAEDIDAIKDAFRDHLVILFRDQVLSPEDQIRLAEQFGPIGRFMRPKELRSSAHDMHDQVMLISNIREDGKPIGSLPDGEMMFHTDTSYDANPHMATMLYAVEVPPEGGHTVFSNQYMVHDALPEATQRAFAGKQAMHVFEFGTTVKAKKRYDRATAPHAPHPVFRRHPETGRLAAYVSPLTTEEVIDMDEAEYGPMLAAIYDLQQDPDFHYEHVWRVGDLLMWDNRCTMHARTDFPETERRLLRRVTVEGDRPV